MNRNELILCLGVALVTALSLTVTFTDIGITVDEPRYLQRTMAMAYYLRDSAAAIRDGELGLPFTSDFIDRYFCRFNYLPVHPDFFRLLNVPFWLLGKEALGEFFANRLGNMVVFSVLFCPVFALFLKRRYGYPVAVFTLLALVGNGRIFHEAHLATFDLSVMMVSFFAFAILSSGRRGRWVPFLGGIALGCAWNTKAQALFLVGGVLLVAACKRDRQHLRWFVIVLVVATVAYWAGRPWLWHNPLPKLFDTARYFQEWGQGTASFGDYTENTVYFLGKMWKRTGGSGGAPWYYPVVLVSATIPLFILALLPFGLMSLAGKRDRRALFLLGAQAAFALLLLVPTAPRYDGVRLYIVIFPLMFITAAEGYCWLRARFPVFAGPGASAALVLLLLLALGQTARLRPYYEMYYSDTVGGVRGAARLGLETLYSGGCINTAFVRKYIAPLPNGTRLMMIAYDANALAAYVETGVMRNDLALVREPPQDLVIVLNRQGMLTDQLRAFMAARHPVLTASREGVPVWWIFQGER